MKKIGILTFHHVLNYGAVLQCFALRKAVIKLGFDCEVINYHCKKIDNNEKYLRLDQYIAINLIKYISQYSGNKRKKEKFIQFLYNECRISSEQTINISYDNYYAIIVGSDQVWNLNLTGADFTYFLENQKVKKIAYAASFGEEDIPPIYEKRLIEMIKEFDSVSMREKESCNYLKRSDISSIEVCDPVYLLTKNEWEEIIPKSNKESSKFILIYCIEKSKRVFNYARAVARKHKLKIIYLNQNVLFKEKNFEYRRGQGPYDFLWYISNAEIIITNSFHGTSFSLLFHKCFVSDDLWHGKINKRIENILCLTNLTDRTISKMIDKDPFDKIDYSYTDKVLNTLRIDSIQYLKNSIED